MKSSGIGGQAVIEGIMMKNGDTYSIAVRKPDGEIDVQVDAYNSIAGKSVLRKIPIVRGVINFVDSLVLGMKCLTHSADFYDDEEPSKTDDVVQKLFKDRAEDVVTGLTVVFSIVMAVGIFMVLPYFIAEYLKQYIVSDTLLAVIEGVIRLLLFITYVLLISRMRDIQRVFQYHGAEHKCINCIENGWELNTKNVRKASKHHRRCGTSFMLIVMVISIIFFIFIRVESPVQRVLIRVALVPVIAGVSYEFIRFAGNTENAVVRFLSIPGMWLQALTTREPDRKMMEVGIAAVEAVFDWRAYQAGMGVVFEEQDDGLDAYMEDETEETGAFAEELATNVEGTAAHVEETAARMGETTAHVEKSAARVEETTAHVEEAAHVGETTAHVEKSAARVEETIVHVKEPVSRAEGTVAHVEEPVSRVEGTTAHAKEAAARVGETAAHVEAATRVGETTAYAEKTTVHAEEPAAAKRKADVFADEKAGEPEETDDLDGIEIEILDIEEPDKKEEVKKKPQKTTKPEKKKQEKQEKKSFWGRKEKKTEKLETKAVQKPAPVETQEEDDDWDWRNPVWSKPEPEPAATEKTEGNYSDIPEIKEKSR